MNEDDLSEIFGSFKRRRSGQSFKNEARRGWKDKEFENMPNVEFVK